MNLDKEWALDDQFEISKTKSAQQMFEETQEENKNFFGMAVSKLQQQKTLPRTETQDKEKLLESDGNLKRGSFIRELAHSIVKRQGPIPGNPYSKPTSQALLQRTSQKRLRKNNEVEPPQILVSQEDNMDLTPDAGVAKKQFTLIDHMHLDTLKVAGEDSRMHSVRSNTSRQSAPLSTRHQKDNQGHQFKSKASRKAELDTLIRMRKSVSSQVMK